MENMQNQPINIETIDSEEMGVENMNNPLINFKLITVPTYKTKQHKINAITFSKEGKVTLSTEISQELNLTNFSSVEILLETVKTEKTRKVKGIEKKMNLTTTKRLAFRFGTDEVPSAVSLEDEFVTSKMPLKTDSKSKKKCIPAKEHLESEVQLKQLLKGYKFDNSAVTILADYNTLIVDLMSKGKKSINRKSTKSQKSTEQQQSA